MALTLDLSPETETRLRETAAQQGQDPATFATAAVEEKLQRVAVVQTTPTNGARSDGARSNSASAHGEHIEGEGTKEGAGEPLMLDKALAGLTGVFNSQDKALAEGQTLDKMLAGRTGRLNFEPADLSARTEEAFAELMDEKFPRQGSDT